MRSPTTGRPRARGFGRPGLLVGAALLMGLPATLSRALDFQLHPVTTVDDGIPHEHAAFSDHGPVETMIDLPRHWNTTSDASSVTSVPPNMASAQIRIEKSTLTPGTPFREAGLDAYRQRALSTVPRGAAGLSMVEEKPDPLPVFGWKDYEFTVAYEFFGQSLRRSVVFINLNAKEQIMVSVVARQADFDTVQAQGMEVMRSWSPAPVR